MLGLGRRGLAQARRSQAPPAPSWPAAHPPAAGPRLQAHLPQCSRCPRGCWSSFGPWWTTQRTWRPGCSQCNPGTRLSQCPAGWADPGKKQGSLRTLGRGPHCPRGAACHFGWVAQPTPGRVGLGRCPSATRAGEGMAWRSAALTWEGGTRSKFFPSILRMCFRACEVIWCLRRKENWQPSRMQWKWLFTWLYLQPADTAHLA